MKGLAIFLACAGAAAASAAEPLAELSATATNLVVTEETAFAFRLWLPPLEGDLADLPPVLSRRPPHVQAPFLDPDGVSGALAPADAQNVPPLKTPPRRRDAAFYTLNDYVSDNPLAGMRDPFALLDDDFFGRALGPQPQRFPFEVRRAVRGGVKGWELSFATEAYRAEAPGRVEIAPVSVKVPLIAGVQTRRDRLGGAVRVPVVREVVLRARPLVVEVAGPPESGRPASYCGAVASNLAVTATLDASVCKVGDPLMFALDVVGARDAASLDMPSFAAALRKAGLFRLDEASLKTETRGEGRRRFSWRVRALKAGTVEFPSLEVSYYNLARRDYETVRTDAIPVQVKAGAQAALDVSDEEADAFPPPDGVDLDLRGAAAEPLLPHLGLSLVLFAAGPFLFLFVRAAPPLLRRAAARRTARRRARAFAVCRRALAKGDAAACAAAIRRFFADRYAVDGATVTAGDARRLMAGDFSDEEVAQVADALADLARANYAAKRAVVSVLAVCLAVCGAWAASAEFTYRRASSLATHAADAAGFGRAADAYAACEAEGAANPVLYSNLGACALMAGDARRARAAYECAERRGGETATTRRGLRAAEARLRNDPRAALSPARALFRPHVLFPLDARLVFAAGAWALLWALALLPAGGGRRVLMTCAALAFLAAAVSVSVSLAAEAAAQEVLHAAN